MKPGDRVRVCKPGYRGVARGGAIGTVISLEGDLIEVRIDNDPDWDTWPFLSSQIELVRHDR